MSTSSSPSKVKMEGGGSTSGSSRRSSSKSRSKGGQLTRIQEKVWKTIKGGPSSTMTQAQAQEVIGNISVSELSTTINSLVAKSLLRMQTNGGVLEFVASSRADASTMGKLEEDEGVIFSHIRESKGEGIWKRTLKNKINVHQTVLDRCIKSLERKGLIKRVNNVKFPTRQIYMASGVEPSIALSGGPWYTDNELDTLFIEQLSRALHAFVVQKTWPEASLPQNSASEAERPLFLASHTAKLPSTHTCWKWLTSKKLTDTKLSTKDVQGLLDVLVYDGKIEKIPFVRLEEMDDEAEFKPRKSKKRRYKRSDSESDDESQPDDDESDRSASDSGSDDSDDSRRSRKKKRRSSSKSSKRSRSHSSRKSKNGKSRRKNDSKSKSIRLSDDDSETEEESDSEDDDDYGNESDAAPPSNVSDHVYRAMRQLRADTGWVEVPCAHCPVFEFCHPGGPVNGEACLYLRDWMKDTLASYAKKAEETETVQLNGAYDGSIAYEDEGHGDATEEIGGNEEEYLDDS